MENVRVQTYAKAARAATALAEIGLKVEALSTLSQVINVSSTDGDLRALRQFVVPSIERIEPDAVLQKLGRFNAVRIRSRADLLSEPSRVLYGLEDGSGLKNEIVIDLVPKKKPFEIFENARAELAKGRSEVLTVLVDSALATGSPTAAFVDVFNLLQHSLKRRELPKMPKDLAVTIGEAAIEFATGGAYSAARTAGVIWSALSPARVSLTQRVVELLKATFQKERELDTSDPAATLYRLGYPAQSSELFHFAGHGESDVILPPWANQPGNERFLLMLNDATMRNAVTGSLDFQQQELIRTVSFDDIVNTIGDDLRKRRETRSRPHRGIRHPQIEIDTSRLGTTRARPNPAPADSSPAPSPSPPPPARRINVWLEDASLPLLVHHSYDLWVDIGAPRGEATASEPFREPNWGKRESLAIVLILTAGDAEIAPQTREATLPRRGDMTPVSFTVTPLKADRLHFNVTVVTQREWDVLERVSFTLDAIPEPEAATA